MAVKGSEIILAKEPHDDSRCRRTHPFSADEMRRGPRARLDKTLDEAKARGWTVIGMKDDRRRVFPFAGPKEP